jgi:hypothetical protein
MAAVAARVMHSAPAHEFDRVRLPANPLPEISW